MTTTNTYGRQVVVPLTNKSGGGVIAGDVVVVGTANNDAFTTTTSAAFTGTVGIAQETIADNATGRVLISGYAALVNVTASVTRQNYGTTSTTVKKAVDAGATRTVGTFCQFLTGGTTPDAIVYPADLGAGTGAIATDAIWDAAGDLVQGTGANTAARLAAGGTGDVLGVASGSAAWGSPMKGFPIALTPPGCAIAWAGTNSSAPTNATADIGRAAPIIVPGHCRIRSMWIHVGTNGSGAVEWGLFDLSTTLTGATKVAGGSAAPGGTGWREITATGAPVAIKAGNYMLIVENPAANASTISTYTTAAAPGFFKAWATYSWDDTPDLTSGSWADSSLFWLCYLEGDLDASNTRW